MSSSNMSTDKKTLDDTQEKCQDDEDYSDYYEDDDDVEAMQDYYNAGDDNDDDYIEAEDKPKEDLNEVLLKDIKKARELFGDDAVEVITSHKSKPPHILLHLSCDEIDVYTAQTWNINKDQDILIEI